MERPGAGARFVSALLLALPKVGPLKALKVILPTPEAEQLFIRSFDTVSRHYRSALTRLREGPTLANVNFDTGDPSTQGKYDLADETYYNYLVKLQDMQFRSLSSGLRAHILRYYAEQGAAKAATQNPEQWAKTTKVLQALKGAAAVPDN
jgi:hypothetical protein